GGPVGVTADGREALVCLQIEVDPRVDATLAEVAIEGPIVAVFLEQLAEVAEIITELERVDRRVFPALPCVLVAGDPGRGAEARLADLPQVLFLGLVVEE